MERRLLETLVVVAAPAALGTAQAQASMSSGILSSQVEVEAVLGGPFAQSVLVSRKLWDSLAPAQREVLSDAAAEAVGHQRHQARAHAEIARENLRKNGMQVTELPPAEWDGQARGAGRAGAGGRAAGRLAKLRK